MSSHDSNIRSHVAMQAMTRLLPVLMCVAILWGCSSTTLIHPESSQDGISYSEFNQEMQSSQVNIELSDRRSFLGREIQVMSDSIRFLDVRTDIEVTIPTFHLKEVTLQDHAAGHSRGVLIGAVVGGVVGIGILTGFDLVGSRWAELWNVAFGGGVTIGGVLLGGLAGGAIGSAVGYTRNFVIAGDSLRVK